MKLNRYFEGQDFCVELYRSYWKSLYSCGDNSSNLLAGNSSVCVR